MRNHVEHADELRLEMALGLRIAPLGTRPRRPDYDIGTIEGAIFALCPVVAGYF